MNFDIIRYPLTILASFLAIIFFVFAVWYFYKVAEPEKDKIHDTPRQLLFGVFSTFMLCIFFYAAFFVSDYFLKISPEGFGQFGDYLGGVLNPIVSFAALYGLWKTLDAQKKSADESNSYLKSQIQKDENKHNDSMFIELMAQYRSILDDVEMLENSSQLQGKSKLKIFRESILVGGVFKDRLPENITNDAELNQYVAGFFPNSLFYGVGGEVASKNIHTVGAFCDEIEVHLVSLKPYFRIVYHVLKLQSTTKSDLKYKNSKYFRAQLTEVELQLIAINAMFDTEGIKGMQKLLKEFALLKHMRDPVLKRFVSCKIGDECFSNKNEDKYDNS